MRWGKVSDFSSITKEFFQRNFFDSWKQLNSDKSSLQIRNPGKIMKEYLNTSSRMAVVSWNQLRFDLLNVVLQTTLKLVFPVFLVFCLFVFAFFFCFLLKHVKLATFAAKGQKPWTLLQGSHSIMQI